MVVPLGQSTDPDAYTRNHATEGLELTGAVKATYLRGKRVYDRESGFTAGEAKLAGQLLL